jgi:hypothetical protein
MNQLKEFKLSYNRHKGKYDAERPNYNYALYNTKYYYADQNLNIFKGDTDFMYKAWRTRSRVKYYIGVFTCLFIFLKVQHIYGTKRHRYARDLNERFNAKAKENQDN